MGIFTYSEYVCVLRQYVMNLVLQDSLSCCCFNFFVLQKTASVLTPTMPATAQQLRKQIWFTSQGLSQGKMSSSKQLGCLGQESRKKKSMQLSFMPAGAGKEFNLICSVKYAAFKSVYYNYKDHLPLEEKASYGCQKKSFTGGF